MPPELQESIRDVLFTETGLYAMEKGYITVEQFSHLSKNAQSAMGVIFYYPGSEYGEDNRVRRDIDRLFSDGFDFEAFSSLAGRKEARDYLLDYEGYKPRSAPR